MATDVRRLSVSSLLLALLLAGAYLLGWTQGVDNVFLQTWFQLRGVQAAPSDIIVVKLGQDFVDAYDFRVADLDRRFYARALSNLNAAGARAVGFDFFFPEQSRAEGGADPDAALAEAVLSGNVVLPQVRMGSEDLRTADHLPFHPLLRGARRGVLSLSTSAYTFEPQVTFLDGTLPSFALATLQAAELRPNRSVAEPQLVDYRGPEGTFTALSFLDVYRGAFSYSAVQNKLVFVGVSLTGTDQDQILTPFGAMSGVEVNANLAYTLLGGRLVSVSRPLYALLLVLSSFVWSPLVRRRRALRYLLIGLALIFAVSLGLFFLSWFAPPPWFALVAVFTYLAASYRQLVLLDTRLSQRLTQLLDTATLAESGTMLPTQLSQGFSPRGYVTHAPDMLESLLSGLGGDSGLLIIERGKTVRGEPSETLRRLTDQALQSGKTHSEGTLPYHIAEPILLDSDPVGAVALTLPAPLPPHLRTLLKTSATMFSQLARYQQLRSRTETLADTLWPWRSQSSLDKIEALKMVGDLLATERGWLGALIETLPQAVFIMSPYGYGVYENAAARRLFKREKNMLRALPEALKIEPERFQEDYVRTVERGEELELGLTERATERPVLLTLRVVRSGSEVRGVAGIVSDLSKIEEMDRKRQELIGMVVHDLRSPLTSIQGFADILLDSADDAQRESLDIIAQEAGRMRRMTDVFLDVVKLESGGVEPERSPGNLAELLRYAIATISAQAAQKDIIIQVDAPTFVAAHVDPDLISRLMINLLSNAVKYSPAATRISAALQQSEGAWAVLEVRDEGYGMTEEQLSQLFQKYKRAPEGKARATTGTGLGLYLVKLITDAHGGDVEVESEVERGSVFRVRLPCGEPPE